MSFTIAGVDVAAPAIENEKTVEVETKSVAVATHLNSRRVRKAWINVMFETYSKFVNADDNDVVR